jgi:3-phenylpropionate/trans-cinnamate dioxygenase ferredoxin reductase subunit
MLLGHAFGEPVLLARHGASIFAVGATCTHYGAPLCDGLLVGDTVRCPWHHACFDLRTGEALRAPALRPLSSWEVVRRLDRVFVARRRDVRLPNRGDSGQGTARPLSSIVIVGAGAAGTSAAMTLRREGYDGRVTLIGGESSAPYDRPSLSKDFLAGSAPEEWLPLHDLSEYESLGIRLVLGAEVTRLDASSHTVMTADGRAFPYDAVLLATGARPVRLSLPGAELPHVHYLRSLADCRGIIAQASSGRRAVLLGAGFIGLEVAAALVERGLEVHVVAPERQVFARVLGAELGDFLRSVHEQHGIVFHLEETVARIAPDRVTLAGGKLLLGDLVVVGAGVRPEARLAERAGLALNDGVLVDEYLRTSVPGIYAAGDIARWLDRRTGRRLRIEHWVVAERMGQAAARSMLGQRQPFDIVPFFWSRHHEVTVSYVGHAERWGRVEVTRSPDSREWLATYYSGDQAVAVATIGRDRASLAAEAEFEERNRWRRDGAPRRSTISASG